jgi:hypothetical protein
MNFKKYKALIGDTMIKEARSKTLLFIFIATTLSIVFGQLVIGAINKEMAGNSSFSMIGVDILSINFRILNSVSFIIAAVFGVSIFRSDFSNNIIYQYLSFPISRAEYFFCRVVGTWILVLGYYLYAYILSSVLFSMVFKKMVFTSAHFFSFTNLAIYLLLVIFISIFFSLLMNKIGALFVTFITCIMSSIAYGNFSRISYKELFSDFSLLKSFSAGFYFLFPRISFLSEESSYFLSSGTSGVNYLEQVIHLVLVSSLYIFLANYFIRRKDF